jgi:hypothetical protein
MFKIFSATARLTAVLSLVLALPGFARVAQMGTTINRMGSALEKGGAANLLLDQKGGLPGLAEGKGLDMPGLGIAAALPKMVELMGGAAADPNPPVAKPKPAAPSGPTTLIHYVGRDETQGKSEGTVITQLPPGAKTMVVDGRLQIYYPNGKPKKK